jgi:broad specificity phosphatase PhoE
VIDGWEVPAGVGPRIVLIRHGEPEASALGRCYGKLDVGLSERGREQTDRLGRRVEGLVVDEVFASPRRRARESAERIFGGAVVDDAFAEIDFGVLEGRTYEEAERLYPEVYTRWMEAPTEVEFPGGESFAGMKSRVLDAVGALRARDGLRCVAVVSHGGVGRIVLADALGLRDESVFRLEQSYAGLSVVDFYEDYAVVRVMNAVAP